MSYWYCWEELGASVVFALFKSVQWSPTQMLSNQTCCQTNLNKEIQKM